MKSISGVERMVENVRRVEEEAEREFCFRKFYALHVNKIKNQLVSSKHIFRKEKQLKISFSNYQLLQT